MEGILASLGLTLLAYGIGAPVVGTFLLIVTILLIVLHIITKKGTMYDR